MHHVAADAGPLDLAAMALAPEDVPLSNEAAVRAELDEALSAIRSATLAFQRCNLQMTSDDAAVAHCDEARVSDGLASSRRRPVAWTIDFRRDDTRWQIERISTSTTASNR